MLVLTRRVGEKIRINDDIVITLLGVRGNQYKVGIDAPTGVTIHRQEIWDRIQEDKRKVQENEVSASESHR